MKRGDSQRAQPDADFPQRRRAAGIRRLIRDFLALDRRALVILTSVPVLLTLLEYYGLPWHYSRARLPGRVPGFTVRDPHVSFKPPPPGWEWIPEVWGQGVLPSYLWWGLACIVLLVLAPMVIGWTVGASPRELGLRVKGTLGDAKTYLLLYGIFFPVIWIVSHSPHFLQTYPFYKPPAGKVGLDFVLFEAVYFLQFLGIEFFFRGFIVLGLKPRLGLASVLVMLAPYCMIHYYKPFPEAMGAIGAGLVLGLLAWRTGTVVYGWFLHYGVALTMDLLALHRTDVI